MDIRKQLGNSGEQQVADYLKGEGFAIICSNYATRTGEVDLIVQKGNTVAFVEVKTRRSANFDLSSVVTYTKQKRIAAAAQTYIAHFGCSDTLYRFDVALVESGKPITYIPDAFWV